MSEFKIKPHKTVDKVKLALAEHGLSDYTLECAQMKLEDGVTVLEAEEFEAGFSVGIVTEEGIIAAPIGEHKLEDGRVLIIEEEGIIARIEAMSEEEPMEEEVEASTESAPVKKTVETVSKETFFSLQEDSKMLMSEHELALSKIETLEAEKKELEVKLAKLEEVKPIVHNPENKSKSPAEMTPLERFRMVKNNLK
jgi:CBS domain-containing protein